MFERFFGRERAANRRVADALYANIVAAARQPRFYSAWQVPDTPLGRFEMLSLHMFLFQRRLRGEGPAERELAQTLIDAFFIDVEHSLRELGIGDMGVPKRMKKLARMHYGRSAAYEAALEAGDGQALAAALARNVRPDQPAALKGRALAEYVAETDAALRDQASSEILSGLIVFPAPRLREEDGRDAA